MTKLIVFTIALAAAGFAATPEQDTRAVMDPQLPAWNCGDINALAASCLRAMNLVGGCND